MKKVLLEIGVALFFGAFCITSCTDEKDEANADSSNTENTSNPSGGSGTSGGSGVSGANRLPKGDARMVDLGLPSGTKWADRNVGASAPEAYGNYYAWGEISSKSDYSLNTYLDGNIAYISDFRTEKNAMKGITDIAGNATYDAATANWGAGYKMPTKAQWNELRNSDYTTWTWCDGVNEKYNNTTAKGFKVTSKTNGNSIFFPAAGFRFGTYTYDVGSCGHYWSSSLYESGYAWDMYFMNYYSDDHKMGAYDCFCGLSVRAVSE